MSGTGRPPRLGRGLAALIGELDEREDAGPRTGGTRVVAVTALVPGPFQPRRAMSDEGLDELAASVRAHGLLQPVLVRPDPTATDRFQIIAGERRWHAVQRAGLHEIPVTVRALDDADAMAASLIENLQRQDLNAIEEAEGLRRLSTEFGVTQDSLARSVGKSRSHVANTLRLLSLPDGVQADVRRGVLTAGHARALLGHPDPARAALQVVSRGLNVRQTEALAKPAERQVRAVKPRHADMDLTALERRLTEALGLRARLTFDGKGGELVLSYRSTEQLEGLLRLLAPDRD